MTSPIAKRLYELSERHGRRPLRDVHVVSVVAAILMTRNLDLSAKENIDDAWNLLWLAHDRNPNVSRK